jgi:hypothetical protein
MATIADQEESLAAYWPAAWLSMRAKKATPNHHTA